MKGIVGELTASMLMGVMLIAFALGIAFVLTLETMELSRGEKEFYMGEKPPYEMQDLWAPAEK